jgi:hypothetical protein
MPDRPGFDLLTTLKVRLEAVEKSLESFVTKKEFEPVRNLVYGLVAAILLAVIGALLRDKFK